MSERPAAVTRDLVAVRRGDLEALAAEVAPTLLGGVLQTVVDGSLVRVRLTEVEAYHGHGSGDLPDPGSHARMGRTARNATMWGEPGHLYVYLSHGIHSCVNVACGPEGRGDGILLRAGEVIEGADTVALRRSKARSPHQFARGAGRFGQAVGLRHPRHDGLDAITGAEHEGAAARLLRPTRAPSGIRSGPRVGVAGAGGTSAFAWRFWIDGDPTVSPFRWGRGAAEAEHALTAPRQRVLD